MTLKPLPNDTLDFLAVLSVPGRTATQTFMEFGGPWPGFAMTGKELRTVVDVRLGHHDDWTELLEFQLLAQGIANPDRYITYGNAPNLIPDGAVEKANRSAAELIAKVEAMRRATGTPDDDHQV